MRPDRAIVKKAIVDAGGNLTRAAALLGCSRQALYTWIYQMGLEKIAQVRLDTREELDRRERQHSRDKEWQKSAVNSRETAAPMLRAVEATEAREFPVQATIKVPESFWRRVRKAAIDEGLTVSEFVRRRLERSFDAAEPQPKPKAAKAKDGAK